MLSSVSVCSQSDYFTSFADSALKLTGSHVIYDPSYFSVSYPNGDVPAGRGVCTDVVIRAYRMIGIDLQELVHEDMRCNFNLYPKLWGLNRPDSNIDHRRVPNLMVFFKRFGKVLPISSDAGDYKAGDILCWDLGNAITHIGIVANKLNNLQNRPMIIHNIGQGQVLADCLFKYKIIGHYCYPKR